VADHTFLLADLSGFTALTEAHGDEEAADLAAVFYAEARALLAEHGGEEVKTLGDAIMVRCDAARSAVALGLRLVQEVGAKHGFPSVRVGLHSGPAVGRDGDWFGATVNIAARISGAAAGGEVLLSAATAAAAGANGDGELGAIPPHTDVRLRPRGRRALRNVGVPVELFECTCEPSRSAGDLEVDPVCRMAVDPGHAAGTLRHGSELFYFCSLRCAEAFAADPGRYTDSAATNPERWPSAPSSRHTLSAQQEAPPRTRRGASAPPAVVTWKRWSTQR
jgi:class 3 adenylate cyclase/YHS domain-containing protein